MVRLRFSVSLTNIRGSKCHCPSNQQWFDLLPLISHDHTGALFKTQHKLTLSSCVSRPSQDGCNWHILCLHIYLGSQSTPNASAWQLEPVKHHHIHRNIESRKKERVIDQLGQILQFKDFESKTCQILKQKRMKKINESKNHYTFLIIKNSTTVSCCESWHKN